MPRVILPCHISIDFCPPTSERPVGYLGAIAYYDSLPGEYDQRAADLVDGPANEKTLLEITDDIRAVMEGFRKAYDRDILNASAAKQPERSELRAALENELMRVGD